ncbi:MAG: GAF domain-containing protein [Chloroflexi bacterium]|nr:GAF domain-containing protein [Chloroflexota bacterium]
MPDGPDENTVGRAGTHAGPISAAIREARSYVCNDAREDTSPIWGHENVLKQQCRSFAAFPLRIGTRTAGAIFVYSAETAFFSGDEVRLLTELAGDVSFAMESADRETRRRQAEERARELREYLQLQVDRMPIALITWDEQFRVRSWNPAAESMFGYPREEALGKHAYELIVPKEVQPHVDDVWRRLLEGDSTAHSVNENITKGGRTVVCQWANTPLKNDDGEAVGVLSMVQDITEQKAAESRVQRRLEFEHVIASISARFVAPANMNAAVNLSLADIGALSAGDRAYLFLLREGGTLMDNTHEWCAEGVSPQIDNLKGLPSETFPWWMSKLRNGEVIHITDVSRLPPEAKAEKDILEYQEIKSLIVLPVHASGELAGFVGLDNVRHAGSWNEDDLAVLRVTSQIIGNAIGRSRAEQGLKDREERLRALYDVGRGLAGSLSTRLLSQLALGEALKVATLDAGIIRYLDNATDELILVTTSGLPDELEATMRKTAGRVKLGHGFAGEAAQTGRAIVVEEVEGDGRCLVPDLVKFGFHSATYLPLKAKDRVVGVISGYSKMKRTFEQQDMEVLTALGTMVGMAMANARLFEQTESAKREWEQTFDSMSEGVAIISPERRIMRANRALAGMLGCTSADELVGKHCHSLVHGLDKPPPNCPTCECLLTKRSCETIWQEPHLGGRWLSLKGDPMLDANGEVAQIVHTFADVTEQKKRQKAMERLHDMSRALSSTLELHEAMRIAVREVGDIFGGAGSTIGIALLDDWRQRLDIAAALGPRQGDWEGISLPLDQLSPEGVHTLLQERRPWLQSDLTQSSEAAWRLPGLLGHRSLIALPLVSRNQAIGVVFLARAEAGLPAEDDVALLETCSGEIARAIHNAQLFTRTDSALRRRIAEQEALTGVLGAATKSLDLDSVLKDALKRAAEALDVDAAGIALADETGQRLTVQSAYERKSDSYRAVGVDLDLSKLPSLQALIKGGQPIVVPDRGALPAGDEKAFAEQWRTRSALVLPIVLAGRMLGTLQFSTETAPKNYTANEVSLARAISNHLASVIQNARLYESTERERSTLESIMASMNEGLLVMDARGNILYCNKAAEKQLGLRCEDFLGLSENTFREALELQVDDADGLRSRWKEALAGLREKPKFGFEVKTRSGKRNVEAAPFLVGDEHNRLGVGILFRDITREREIDRMKTEFISVASHELRTPMTSVYGFAELLLMRATGLAEDQRKWVETIYAEGKRLADIVEDLLNVSRIESGLLPLNLGAVSLEPMVTSIIGQVGLANPSRSLISQIPEGFPSVRADKDKLHRVLYNLVDNAVKYSPSGGPVIISAECNPSAGTIVFSVSDRGLGIPAEEIPKLFGRFHRVRRPETEKVRGTGLGLYIVKSLVESMSGNIRVESQLNQGSTFYVTLPVAEAQPK